MRFLDILVVFRLDLGQIKGSRRICDGSLRYLNWCEMQLELAQFSTLDRIVLLEYNASVNVPAMLAACENQASQGGGKVASRLVPSTADRAVRSGLEPWQGTLCCVLGQDTLLLQCLSTPRCTNFVLAD